MIRIINNTDIDFRRLLSLYKPELDTIRGKNIECIVFDTCRMCVYGIDCLLLEVDDQPKL